MKFILKYRRWWFLSQETALRAHLYCCPGQTQCSTILGLQFKPQLVKLGVSDIWNQNMTFVHILYLLNLLTSNSYLNIASFLVYHLTILQAKEYPITWQSMDEDALKRLGKSWCIAPQYRQTCIGKMWDLHWPGYKSLGVIPSHLKKAASAEQHFAQQYPDMSVLFDNALNYKDGPLHDALWYLVNTTERSATS